jgi:hypothetical protein
MLSGQELNLLKDTLEIAACDPRAMQDKASRRAAAQFRWARLMAILSQAAARLTGRSNALLALCEAQRAGGLANGRGGMSQPVPIRRIRGSEGRCQDFDAAFRPLSDRAEARWKSLAYAMQTGVTLPPVDLIQVGDAYYVRDGHHRVSVARALGQEYVDACVTVWSAPSAAPAPRGQLARGCAPV